MYEFYNANLTAPAGWCLLICLIAAAGCHLMALHITMQIEQAEKTAQAKVKNADLQYVAIKERQLLVGWSSARRLFLQLSPLFLFAWLVGLGRPGA